jgi:hypothetical protein
MKSNFPSDFPSEDAFRAPQDPALMNSALVNPALINPSMTPDLIDPESYDAREQQFTSSPDEMPSGLFSGTAPSNRDAKQLSRSGPGKEIVSALAHDDDAGAGAAAPPVTTAPSTNSDAWRQEVAARLSSYRARRRPREHRYPSLQLKFEPSDPEAGDSAPSRHPRFQPHIDPQSRDRYAAAAQVARNGWPADQIPVEAPAPVAPPETARVIPFRRTIPGPPRISEELAEPMQLFPRILDVPEVAPAPPALGGILIEPAPEEPSLKRRGIEIPLQTSPISRRLVAAFVDWMVVASAFGIFAYIFFRITGTIPQWKQSAAMAAFILGVLWAGYQYLLLTYVGSTPGLKLASLELNQFDGSLVPRERRRWRAFVSVLSGLSLGLGYAWCLLDEDQLCWHDRITRTHLAPHTSPRRGVEATDE